MRLTFKKQYFFWTVIFLILEVLIAMFVRDRYIRPYGGDFLVVIFLYCLLKSFIGIEVKRAILLVLCFAYLVEFSQYWKLSAALGLENDPFATVVLGNSFEWLDIFIYTMAGLSIWGFESRKSFFSKPGKVQL